MMEKDTFLEAEETLNKLIKELEDIKKASTQLKNADKIVKISTDNSKKLSTEIVELQKRADTILKNLEETEIKEKYEEMAKELKMLKKENELLKDQVYNLKESVSFENKKTASSLDELRKSFDDKITDFSEKITNNNERLFNLKKSTNIFFGGFFVLQVIILILMLVITL
jgi:hypothetical protein